MTEFYKLGKHCDCEGCKQLDFLPFTCTGCKKVFCLEHRGYTAHNCKDMKSVVIPQCPICNQLISISKGDDPNAKVDEHISKGCPKESTESVMVQCSYKKCKQSEITPIICNYCKKNFCIRHAQDHECEQEGLPKSNMLAAAAEKRMQLSDNKKLVQQRIDALVKQQSDLKPTAKKVQIIKMKTKSTGNKSVPEEKRFYLEVLFPLASNVPPKMMYYNREWTIGKVLDIAAEAGGIENKNNQSNAEKLHLISLKSGVPLENSISLQDYAEVLQSGDSVLLETLQNVAQ